MIIEDFWMKVIAEQERLRRAKVETFVASAPNFLQALTVVLRTDLKAYETELPTEGGERTSLTTELASGRINILCTAYKPPTGATISLNATFSTISCSFQNVDTFENWTETLYGGPDQTLQLMGVDQGYTVSRLSRKILIPILFKFLDGDPVVQRFLQR